MTKPVVELDPEIMAIANVFGSLKGLSPESQARVIDYVRKKLNLGSDSVEGSAATDISRDNRKESVQPIAPSPEAVEGVSPIAEKWLRRSGLTLSQVERVFNIGADDEIDLVAAKLPGTTKASHARAVVLLKAAANYLSTGVPKVAHDVVKQTCGHYDAYDSTNFAKVFKTMGPEITGNKQSGYTLTARGLAAASDLIKEMTATK